MNSQPRNSTLLSKARFSQTLATLLKEEPNSVKETRTTNHQLEQAEDIYASSSLDIQSQEEVAVNYWETNCFSDSFLAKNRFNSKLYIKRVISLNKLDPSEASSIEEEVKLLNILSHKNLFHVYAYSLQGNDLELLEDYSKESLHDFLEKKSVLNEVNAFHIFLQLVDGLSYLHSKQYTLHGKLNVEKIGLTPLGRVIISSKVYPHKECLHQFYELNEDFFALGVILARMTKGFNDDVQISRDCEEMIRVLIDNEALSEVKEVYEMKWMKRYMNDQQEMFISQFHEFASEKTNEIKMKMTNEVNNNWQPPGHRYSSSILSCYTSFLGAKKNKMTLESSNNINHSQS